MSEQSKPEFPGLSFENPDFIADDGRRFIVARMFHHNDDDMNVPLINTIRPVVDQAKNRLYAFDQDGEGFLLKDYGHDHNNTKMAADAAEMLWGPPSAETWGHTGRPRPDNYDQLLFDLIEEHGAEMIDGISMIQCVDGCCRIPLAQPYDQWQLSRIGRGTLIARAVLPIAMGTDFMISDAQHVVFRSYADAIDDDVEHDTFINMVQMFGEPFDQSTGHVNPIYVEVMEQYQRGSN